MKTFKQRIYLFAIAVILTAGQIFLEEICTTLANYILETDDKAESGQH